MVRQVWIAFVGKTTRKSFDPPDQMLLLAPGLFSDPPHHCTRAVGRVCRSAQPPRSWRDRTSLAAIAGNRLPANGSSGTRGASALPSPSGSNQWRLNDSRGGPVPGLVGGGCGSAHAIRLPHWIHEMNPSWNLCNSADLCSKALSGSSKNTANLFASVKMASSSPFLIRSEAQLVPEFRVP